MNDGRPGDPAGNVVERDVLEHRRRGVVAESVRDGVGRGARRRHRAHCNAHCSEGSADTGLTSALKCILPTVEIVECVAVGQRQVFQVFLVNDQFLIGAVVLTEPAEAVVLAGLARCRNLQQYTFQILAILYATLV